MDSNSQPEMNFQNSQQGKNLRYIPIIPGKNLEIGLKVFQMSPEQILLEKIIKKMYENNKV